ncbi:MAG: guanylate kinase [Bacteroidota bacterium]|jgi:guanylate kinase
MNKLLIFTAPSGAGKTTIVRHLLGQFEALAFSVSATNRSRRVHEEDGKDYYFLSTEAFLQQVKNNDFLEYEEVYEHQFYGTLRSEVERLWALGKCVVFDVDVKGAMAIKNAYPKEAVTVFVKPPSKEILFERLRNRKTESEESLRRRIARAQEELTYESKCDYVLLNDDLKKAFQEAEILAKKIIYTTETGVKNKQL